MLKLTVVLCAVFVAASAFVELAPLETKPDKFKDVPGCYIRELDLVLPLDQSVPGKSRCIEYRCGKEYVDIFGCGKLLVRPECEEVTDEKLPYPECCPQEKC